MSKSNIKHETNLFSDKKNGETDSLRAMPVRMPVPAQGQSNISDSEKKAADDKNKK